MRITEQSETTGNEATRRLLDVAEELFAEKGFDATSVREITGKAECNLAAVNYHFGSKEDLYREVFRRRLAEMRSSRIAGVEAGMAAGPAPTLEGLLAAFAHAFIEPFARPEDSHRFMRLFGREMVDQRLPRTMFLDELAAPTISALGKALQILCPRLDPASARYCIFSLVAQLVHVEMIGRMIFSEQSPPQDFDRRKAVDHIVAFSAAGIRACEGRSAGRAVV